MHKCVYCGSELSSLPVLKNHQRKTRYCLDLQTAGSHLQSIEVAPTSDSTSVLQSTIQELNLSLSTRSHDLVASNRRCARLTRELAEMSTLVSSLQSENLSLTTRVQSEIVKTDIYTNLFSKQLDVVNESNRLLSQRSNTHIKNTFINMGTLNLSDTRPAVSHDNFTLDHYNRGGAGSADWVVDNILTDESGKLIYRCTDKNRRQFVYKDTGGTLVNDVNAAQLKRFILPLMRLKILEYRNDAYARLGDQSDDENSTILNGYVATYREHTTLGTAFDRRLVQKTYI